MRLPCGNYLQGNIIGLNASGNAILGNGDYGVFVQSSSNTIGGADTNLPGAALAGAGNVISGQTNTAVNNRGGPNTNGIGIVFIGGSGNLVQGNYIGTDKTGEIALGNANTGIVDWAGPNTIGGPAQVPLGGGLVRQLGNVISGNANGVDCDSSSVIEGNYIGTDANGTGALANGLGFFIRGGASGEIVGGTVAGVGNLISGNRSGIRLHFTSNVQVQGNLIGTDYTGTHAIGNYDGIYSQDGAYNNIIGGTSPGAGNVISGNSDFGVNLYYGTGNGNSILGNSIHDNGQGGINLAGGANNNQASPVLTGVSSSSSGTTISGTLQSVASTAFRVEFFANTTAAYDEGQTYLGFTTVTTNAGGNASFMFTLTTPRPTGQTIFSGTATKLVGPSLTPSDTSEFGNDLSIPVVSAITAPLAPVAVNTAINVSASFSDGILSTTHTAAWSWGDNTTSAGGVTEANGSGTVTGSHSYAADGVYTVTLTVTNNLGGSAQSVFQYVVVYNPSAGFVTGGGWITSLAGAYAANSALTGQANFGFNARYHSGDTVPTGSTQFQFPAANLTFQSASYDWLVITANQAQYQGSGTINGTGNYGFLVTAQDNGGRPADLFRLKIWDKSNNNAVVYDTQPGAPTTAAPTTPLGGGRIQVHTNAQLVAGGANLRGGNPDPLTPPELQPVVQEAIGLWRAAGIDAAQLSALSHVAVGIAALPGPWLGMAFPGAIWIAPDAAGYGWYIDLTPADASAFPAALGSPAYGKVDLLTVVAHELGHELGLDDTAGDGLMGVFLPTGTRRLPGPDQVAARPGLEGAMTAIRSKPPLPTEALLIGLHDGTAKPTPVVTTDQTKGMLPPALQPLAPSTAASAHDDARSVEVLDALLAQFAPDLLAAPIPDPLTAATVV